MLFLPISFFVALLLATLLVRMIRQEEAPAVRPFLLLLAVMAVQSVLVGLRWGYGLLAVMPAMSMLAAVIPPLSFLAFRSLTAAPERESPMRRRLILAMHGLPALLVLGLNIAGNGLLDVVLILTFLGYGLALLWLARLGPDALTASRLDGALRSYRALQCMAASLLASAASDLFISFDFAFADGRHVPAVVSGFMTLVLLALGFAASLAESGASAEEEPGPAPAMPEPAATPARSASDDDARIAAALDAIMTEKQLYKDGELNLTRLARRLGLPARAVSQAVNRVHGISVSHYVNNLRVEEACRLLRDTDKPVTSVVFDAGFMTKSNFNREFLRVTGQNPSAWRQREGELLSEKSA
ncbi:AraC family transcriptional regulator [Allorhizobium taibaishanense]|uniref:AraC family transcriptional regulator n=1 Tax=Allorhizobium taibaishanense TaxID=887144 RepID=A0A1Q8ZZY2_9HYPH|nr:helix-turn-helix domain-containing protein [Allorhizobium taibaishanense]MBB4007251.1 AraC-like DNA-binding protein [Allorhizobium taibaishanense]OLP47749.1 AraC family transcriptional regulator [Allorhizobium taibaishanense]